jgi:EAL domain-containing protein (putative c-di-GMP-specific phosphodiesterase class I)
MLTNMTAKITTTEHDQAAHAAPDSGHALSSRVLQGLRADEFCIAYQGIYRVDTGELQKMEALIRWRHPEYGVLLPGAFCETFKNADVILAVTRYVLDAVARDIAAWLARGGARYPVAVNVPPSVAAIPGFADSVEAVCDAHGISADCIEIELSESEDLTRFPSMPAIVRTFRDKGVNIAMDDFGTGYACLAVLGPIEFGTVKIAKELLADTPRCKNACRVFSSVLALLERLNVSVVVEGVETPAQAQWLAQWPNVLAQGFFLARPAFGIDKVPGAQINTMRRAAQKRTHDAHCGHHAIRLANAA